MYGGGGSQDGTRHHAESCQLCLHHSPSSSSERARAHPKNRPGPLAKHRQPSPIVANVVLHAALPAAHAPGTRPDAPASAAWHNFQSLVPSRSLARSPGRHPVQPGHTPPRRSRSLGSGRRLTRLVDVCARPPAAADAAASPTASPTSPTRPAHTPAPAPPERRLLLGPSFSLCDASPSTTRPLARRLDMHHP
ncbi:hypothetical protein CDD83_10769 [Cordyceps sp. RAO-2017]|nr:hypothetical protein CDD83_10769 [Cordyceps sp. RAO-2017]